MPKTAGNKKSSASQQKLPAWLTSHFKQCLDSQESLFRLVHLSEKGISVLRGMPKGFKVLADVHGKSQDPDSMKRIEAAEKEAELAETEVTTDFPVLHGLAVVAVWSWLEHFVKDLVALWLNHHRNALDVPALQRTRVKLGDYLRLTKPEQAAYLVEVLEQELASSLKRGVTRFESLLEPFSLNGPLPEGCAKTIFELQQVRNVIAHRNGIIDRRLTKECPWLKLRVNRPLRVSHRMLERYVTASAEYLLAVLYRVGDTYKVDLRGSEAAAPNPPLKPADTGMPVVRGLA